MIALTFPENEPSYLSGEMTVNRPRQIAFHAVLVTVLTVLSQLGGLAWLVAVCFRRRLLVFTLAYLSLSVSAFYIAPTFGRVALPCFSKGSLQSQSIIYCVLNRHYVAIEMNDVAIDVAEKMDDAFPGTKTLTLDGGFPYLPYFPVLPHLSHNDGKKLDFAFYYLSRNNQYLPGKTLSPIGYFGFVEGPTQCPDNWLTLRWDVDWLQPLLPAYELDLQRTTALMRFLSEDPRLSKILLEPHLKARLRLRSDKIRFQGCRAARHDDHVHVQL